MVEIREWLMTGEPIEVDGEERVEAKRVRDFHTGPNESRENEITAGSISYEGLEMIEEDDQIQEHVHRHDEVNITRLPGEVAERLLDEFKEEDSESVYVVKSRNQKKGFKICKEEHVGGFPSDHVASSKQLAEPACVGDVDEAIEEFSTRLDLTKSEIVVAAGGE